MSDARTPYATLRGGRIDQHGALELRLYNPGRKNAIGPRMVNELLHALEGAIADDRVRSIVLTGDGDAFCAGGDFQQMGGVPEVSELPYKGDFADLLLAMHRAQKPIVARVNGHALGGGLGLVASSHFAVAADGAKLGTPEIDVGLFPMMVMPVLQRLVGRRRMLQMMLFGERLDAREAADLGIINRAVPLDELDAAVADITARLADKSPIALRLGLEAMADQDDLELEEALPMLRERLARCLSTEDAREGLAAFFARRPPVWRGK